MAISQSVKFKVYRGVWASFDSLFCEASEFATSVGKDRLISISHSEDKDDGIVTVWYWD
jgi:hypothetical protein